MVRVVLGAVAVWGTVFAQGLPGDDTVTAIQPVPPPAVYEPMGAGSKLMYHLKRSVDLGTLSRTGLMAGFTLAAHTPDGWQGNLGGYGIRFASSMGSRLTEQVLRAGFETVLREDPRLIPVTAHGFLARTEQAIVNTFRIKKDDGVTIEPNYSRFLAAYGTGFVSRSWYPPGYRSSGDALVAGTISLGLDAGLSVFYEFWPDIQHKVLHRAK